MPARFYLPDLAKKNSVELEGSEAHHLLHVLRGKPGDEVELFDGNGLLVRATIEQTSRKSATLSIEEILADASCPQPEIVLATAIPKGDRFRWMIEKCTEAGMDRLIPLQTEYSVVSPGNQKLDKLEQTAIAACKQCGRLTLPVFESKQTWTNFLEEKTENTIILIAHPDGILPFQAEPLQLLQNSAHEISRILLCIGPEGGWTEDEVQQAEAAGATRVTLGPNIYRMETAAVLLTGIAALMRPL